MDDLIIINRKPNQAHFDPSGALKLSVWKTCLRQILFTTSDQMSQNSDDLSLLPDDQIFSADKALVFLSEILCGLHSPVFGETEVFGQFKTFVDQQTEKKDELVNSSQKWVRFLYEIVKNIRTQYITGLGSNSYGSTIRKLTRDTGTLSILGAGQLATEILPWIAKNKKVQVLVRNTEKYVSLTQIYNELVVENLYQTTRFNKALILAAPIDSAELVKLISQATEKPEFIYDLRDSGFETLRQSLKPIKMLSLADFFEIFNDDKIKFEKLKNEVNKVIQKKTFDFTYRAEVRPLGWDDLCL